MASPENQESSSRMGQNVAIQQRQQEELIKLIAQHFHHHFYQLASSNSNNNVSQFSNGDGQLQAQTSSSLRAYLQQQQQQLQHSSISGYPSEFLGGVSSGDFNGDSNTMNLCANNASPRSNDSNTLLHDHMLRSQQANMNHRQHLTSANSLPGSLLDFSNHGNTTHNHVTTYPPPLTGLNLINALGLTSNQFVLSLQHQSLIRAATAGQYEAVGNSTDQQDLRSCGANFIRTNGRGNDQSGHGFAESSESSANQEAARNDGLKFSINTILGNASSPSRILDARSDAAKNNLINTGNRGSTKPCGGQANKQIFMIRTNESIDGEHHEQDNGLEPECDPLESGSDSNSTRATPPLPQPGTSILFNTQAPLPIDHRSAITTELLPNISNQRQHNNHQQPLQRHQSQQNNSHPLPFLPAGSAFPWTVAARGKPRRGMMRRAVFSDGQRVGLEKRFQLQKYISKPDRKKLAEKLGLRDSQVKIWFQNRRMKWRNSKERELLSVGGSREQTLPTRNNPNPDLSDVGTKTSTTPTIASPVKSIKLC